MGFNHGLVEQIFSRFLDTVVGKFHGKEIEACLISELRPVLTFFSISFTYLQMLHCIVGMVDKCKRAIASLQEKSQRDREELSMWMHRHDPDLKKREVIPGSLRPSDERMSEVKRRAGKLSSPMTSSCLPLVS